MHILITRYRYKPATIDGQLSIDGIRICDCAENAHTALPPGTYSITIAHCRQYARKMPLITPISNQSLYIKILLLPLHSLTTSRKWNKADQSFVPRQILMFCPHSLTSESGQFTGL